MSSQAECCNLGHQHPRLVAAIRQQAERLPPLVIEERELADAPALLDRLLARFFPDNR